VTIRGQHQGRTVATISINKERPEASDQLDPGQPACPDMMPKMNIGEATKALTTFSNLVSWL